MNNIWEEMSNSLNALENNWNYETYPKVNELQVYKLNQEAILPTRTNQTDAGVDLYSLIDLFVPLNGTVKIPTGVAIRIPEGYVGKVEDRSGLALKGLRTGAGVVDSGYSGELGIVLHNVSNTTSFRKDSVMLRETRGYEVKKGDRVAQLLLYKVETPEIVEVKELWTSERGSKGFNSSGR